MGCGNCCLEVCLGYVDSILMSMDVDGAVVGSSLFGFHLRHNAFVFLLIRLWHRLSC